MQEQERLFFFLCQFLPYFPSPHHLLRELSKMTVSFDFWGWIKLNPCISLIDAVKTYISHTGFCLSTRVERKLYAEEAIWQAHQSGYNATSRTRLTSRTCEPARSSRTGMRSRSSLSWASENQLLMGIACWGWNIYEVGELSMMIVSWRLRPTWDRSYDCPVRSEGGRSFLGALPWRSFPDDYNNYP